MNVSDCLYRLFRPVVDYATRCHYASVTVRGVEQLPKEGGYILAPCHQNAMMEPLLVLVMIPKPVYFICRGDIFANSLANKFLTFLKMFPIFRRRDGLKSLERNKVTFDESQRVLLDGYPLCMMAEGQHNDRHQLLPLVKGMFRIAGTTQAQMGDQPLYIVPLGIDLDDYERPFSHAVLNVGEPIDVRQFMEDFLNDEPKALNAMRETLTQGLKASMHHIESKNYYATFADLCDLMNSEERKRLGLNNTPFNRFLVRQEIAHRLDALEQSTNLADQAELQRLTALAEERRKWCDNHHKRLKSVAEPISMADRLLRWTTLAALVTLFVAIKPAQTVIRFLIEAYPLLLIPTHLLVHHWIEDTQFRSSINFALRFVLAIIYIPVFCIIMTCLHGWIYGLATLATSIIMARLTPVIVAWWRRSFD